MRTKAPPEPPALSPHRHARERLESTRRARGRSAAVPALNLALVVALALAMTACALGKGAKERYDNAVALQSTLHRPAAGSAEDRTYRNSRYRGATFSGVRVRPPALEAASYDDAEFREFLGDLERTLEAGTLQALASVPRLGPVIPSASAGSGSALLCTTQALVHVTPTGYPVGRDPVFRDPRPKLIVVYRIEDAATGEPVFQYTSVGTSHWEYGPWAMEDLLARAVQTAGELRDALAKE